MLPYNKKSYRPSGRCGRVKTEAGTLRAALHGGAGLNSMRRAFLEENQLPLSYRQDFIDAMDRLSTLDVDIFLGNHVEHNQTPERREQLLSGDTDAFVDRTTWSAFCQKRKNAVLSMLKKEAQNT